MVCQNNNKLTKHLLTLSTKQTNNQPSHLRIGRSHLSSHSHLNSRGWGYYKSLIPTLTKLALPSLIILSTIISTCTPILSTTIPSVNAVTANTNQTSSSSTTNVDPSDPNYLNSVLEANGMDTNSVTNTANDVDPTTMATDLASLNNALEAQAANEGISISLTNPSNQPITTTNPATIDIDPSNATGSGVTANTILAATSITSNVKTAMPGYSLSISTNTDNSNLTNTDSNLSSTQNGSNILPTTGTQESPAQLTTNTWGYAMKRDSNNKYTTKFDTTYTTGNTNSLTSKWAKVPTNQAPQTIKHTEDTPQAAGDNTTVYYAANVPKTKTAGNYQTTITYTATANVLDPPEVEKVEPSTIRQGLQMTVGETEAVGIPGSSNYQPAQTFACYVTTAGSVYCAGPATSTTRREGSGDRYYYDYNVAGNWIQQVSPSLTFTYRTTTSGDVDANLNAYTAVQAKAAGEWYWNSSKRENQQPVSYWFKLDTTGMDGGVTQMAVGNAGSSTFACYVTTAGSVYCAGPATSTTRREGSGDRYYYDYNVAGNWIQQVSPSLTFTYRTTTSGDVDANLNAYTAVQAKAAGEWYWNSSKRENQQPVSYWFKLDTTGMDGGVTAGTTITLTGNNLSKVTNVYIDTNNNSALDEGTDIAVSNLKITSDTQLTFTAPSMSPGTYNLIITNPGNVVVKGTLTYR